MCNLYSMTSNQDAIRAISRYLKDSIGNLEKKPAIYANGYGPIVRNTAEGRELAMARWGMPSHPYNLRGKNYDRGVTNCREPEKDHWDQFMDVANRCVVPATSFCEPDQGGGSKENVWFAFDDERPLFFFAGVWTPQWTSVRMVSEGSTTEDLYAFLTTAANDDVRPIHPNAMPVILRSQQAVDWWLTEPRASALELQRPLPNGLLKIVSRGPKGDGPPGTEIEPKKKVHSAPPAQASLF